MTTQGIPKPTPAPTPLTEPFWGSAKRRRLQLPRCSRCEAFHYPPEKYCPRCLHDELVWTDVSGKGTLYSYTVVHQKYHPAFETPYNVAVVELAEGPRMVTNVIGCENDALRVGMALVLDYEDADDEITLPKFRPA